MAKVLKQTNTGRQKQRIDGVGQYDWEEEGGGGGGGKILIGGVLNFDTDSTGNPQTFAGNLIVPAKVGAPTAPDAGKGGIPVPAGTLKNLRYRPDNFGGGDLTAQSCTVTVYVDGAPTALVVTKNDATGGDDTTHTVAVTAGQVVQIRISAGVTDGPSNPQTQIALAASVELEL